MADKKILRFQNILNQNIFQVLIDYFLKTFFLFLTGW